MVANIHAPLMHHSLAILAASSKFKKGLRRVSLFFSFFPGSVFISWCVCVCEVQSGFLHSRSLCSETHLLPACRCFPAMYSLHYYSFFNVSTGAVSVNMLPVSRLLKALCLYVSISDPSPYLNIYFCFYFSTEVGSILVPWFL